MTEEGLLIFVMEPVLILTQMGAAPNRLGNI